MSSNVKPKKKSKVSKKSKKGGNGKSKLKAAGLSGKSKTKANEKSKKESKKASKVKNKKGKKGLEYERVVGDDAADDFVASALSNDLQLDDQNGMYNGTIQVRDATFNWSDYQKAAIKNKPAEKWTKAMGKAIGKAVGKSPESPLVWMLEADFASARNGQKGQKGRSAQSGNEICDLISRAVAGESLPDQAIGVLATIVDSERWIKSLSQSEYQLMLAAINRLDQNQDWFSSADRWMFQLVRIELPLTLAFVLAKDKSLRESARSATLEMAEQIRELLDGDGMPAASCISQFGRLMASWTRCWSMLTKLEPELESEVLEQLEWAVRQLLRMLRPDGSLVFGDGGRVSRSFAKLMLKMSGDKDDAKIAARSLPQPPNKKNAGSKSPLGIDESDGSDWGEVALMQTSWKRKAPKCGVTYQQGECWMDICNSVPLIFGRALPELKLDGQVIKPIDNFELTCWQSDDAADYLEIEIEFQQEVTLQRQIMLAREEEFLYVADVVVLPREGRIEYFNTFPLANGIDVMEETETRELYLKTKADQKIQALVLPLALPEWKVARTDDSLKLEDENIVLRQSQKGRGLFAGVLFDLNSKRSVKPRTWRSLTVAESLEIVPRDVAVAFRVNIGSNQWVFYRVVSETGNRTFLGENFNDDFFAGVFESDGSVRGMMMIE